MDRYFIVYRDGAWKINLNGQYLGIYPTQGVALSAARRLARSASEQGRGAKVLVEGLHRKMRREGVFHPIGSVRGRIQVSRDDQSPRP